MPFPGKARLWVYWAYRESEVADFEVPTADARMEAEAAGDFVASRVKRTRPIVAIAAGIAEFGNVVVARGRQEDTIAIRTFYLIAVLAVLSTPSPAAFDEKLPYFLRCRHAPRLTEFGGGGIVHCFQDGLVIAYELAINVVPNATGLSVRDGIFRNIIPTGRPACIHL